MNYDFVNKVSDIEENLSPAVFFFFFKENNDYVTFYKTEISEKRAPEVGGCPVPLSLWFYQGTDCRLTRKSMLKNFSVYLRTYADNHSSIFE